MPESSTENTAAIETLATLEAIRCKAISDSQWEKLGELLHADFVYGFLSGRLEDKSVYLRGLPNRPHGITSTILSTKIYGITAVMISNFTSTHPTTGEVANVGTALGTWVLDNGSWLLVAYHSTRIATPAG